MQVESNFPKLAVENDPESPTRGPSSRTLRLIKSSRMKTIEIIDKLIDMLHGDGMSRSVLSLSILKQGHVDIRIEDAVNELETSLVGTSTKIEHIKGWQSGWKLSEDGEIICFAVIELELDRD